MVIEYINNKQEVLDLIKDAPRRSILFKRYSERYAYAWVPNGNGSGSIYSVREIKDKLRRGTFHWPSHNYGGNQDALELLFDFCKNG